MASIHLKEAYLQVPVHPASRHFLRFMFRDTVYQFKALCFGLSTAPQVFTRVMTPVSAILHSMGFRMSRYHADWLVQSASRESLLRDLPTVLQLCHELGIVVKPQEIQPGSITGGSVSGGYHRLHLFQGFSVGGAHLSAAVNSRRVSVLHLASRELMALATQRTFFAGSPSSWRQTEDAVPPALPPSILGSSGSGGSSVCVDGVSSRPPVVAPSPLSVSRSVSLPGVSRPTLLVRRLRRGVGCPSRSSDRFRAVGHPPGGVIHKRQGTACCPTGSSPVPVISTGSHGDCLLRQHHSGGLSSQGGWHKISSPQHLGSGDLALDGVPLHPPGSAVPPGLQQRPRLRWLLPSVWGSFGRFSHIVSFVGGVACLSYVPEFVTKSESLSRSIPRSFLVKFLSDFAAGLDVALLLCPFCALRVSLDRTLSLAPSRRRLFVSPSCPTRAMSKNAVSFLLRAVFHGSAASRPEWVRSVPMTFVGFLPR